MNEITTDFKFAVYKDPNEKARKFNEKLKDCMRLLPLPCIEVEIPSQLEFITDKKSFSNQKVTFFTSRMSTGYGDNVCRCFDNEKNCVVLRIS
jgi:hypothetical protein